MKKLDGIQTDLMQHPVYRRAWDRLQELRGEVTALGRKHSDIQAGLAEGGTVKSRRQQAAEAILAGGDPAVRVDNAAADREQLGEIRERLAVLREAVTLQEHRVRDAQAEASREICAAAHPLYRDLVQRLAAALEVVGALADEEAAFRDTLQVGGVSFAGYIRPMPLNSWRLSEADSRANYWLREAREHYGVKVSAPHARDTKPAAA